MPRHTSHVKRSRPRATARRRGHPSESSAIPSDNKAIELLSKWIDEYAADRDPDLDQQMEELRRSRLSLRRQC